MSAAPSITSFRERLRQVLREQRDSGHPRDVVVFALDGIPLALARSAWPAARVEGLQSVFPTTSSTGWLSSLTGRAVAEHGVPGVVFCVPDAGPEPINVFAHRGSLTAQPFATIFTDARRLGYHPVAVAGDLADYACSWRELLLHDAELLTEHRFYTGAGASTPAPDRASLLTQLRTAVQDARTRAPRGMPCLTWCFADIDQHIHRHGYDAAVHAALSAVDTLAHELVDAGCVVVAHADHGLTATEHDPAIAAALDQAAERHAGAIGGAGRCRWVHVAPDRAAAVCAELTATLPDDIEVGPAGRWFPTPGRAAERIGAVVVVATGRRFVTSAGYAYDHGSWTAAESAVPLATWAAA